MKNKTLGTDGSTKVKYVPHEHYYEVQKLKIKIGYHDAEETYVICRTCGDIKR